MFNGCCLIMNNLTDHLLSVQAKVGCGVVNTIFHKKWKNKTKQHTHTHTHYLKIFFFKLEQIQTQPDESDKICHQFHNSNTAMTLKYGHSQTAV